MNKIISYLSILLIILSCNNISNKNLVENIKSTFKNVEIKKLDSYDTTLFKSAYELFITQPIDHKDLSKGTFKQRVLLFNTGDFNKPVVVETHGYNIWYDKETEISKILKCNNITVEHRFFGDSQLDTIPWEYLNVEQSSADIHEIIKGFKNIYTNKWISTGISKGGQSTVFHRMLYPNDVDISVPYVAPINFEREDSRINNFINNEVSTKENREIVRNFQLLMFQNLKEILPLFKTYCNKKNYTFSMGYKRALELSILEYSFAFWQWGTLDINSVPNKKSSYKDMLKNLIRCNTVSFFETKSVNKNLAYFYQALTEIGIYKYDIKPFRKYLSDTTDITFDYFLPSNLKSTFNNKILLQQKNFINNEAKNMIFICGGNDPWKSTSAIISDKTNCLKMVLKNGNHGTRISTFSAKDSTKIIDKIKYWLQE